MSSAPESSPEARPDAAPTITIAEPAVEVARLLRSLQALLLRHPFAASEAVRALVAEGRAFAETEEGRLWKERLEHSSVLRDARTLWEGVVFPLSVDERPLSRLRSFIDDMLSAVRAGGAESALARAFMHREVP
jgi:hypothetical protein